MTTQNKLYFQSERNRITWHQKLYSFRTFFISVLALVPLLSPSTFPPAQTSPNTSFLGSFASNGTLGGVAFNDEDIMKFDGTSWSLYFDGTDVGAGGDLVAFSIVDSDTILMSFSTAVTLNGIAVSPQDLVQFDATSLGSNTAGTFSMYLDGSDVGLDTNNEKIDALSLLPDGRVLISTTGAFSVPGVSGEDEDILAFTPTTLGDTTSGTWTMYFDGSDVGLADTNNEDVDALDVDPNGAIYLSTLGDFSVTGISGFAEDVFVCAPTTLGSDTACNYSSALYFDGSIWGLSANNLDAFEILVSDTFPTATPTNTPTPTNTSIPIPTFTPTNTPAQTNSPTPGPSPTATVTSTPSSGSVVFVGAGDISTCSNNHDEETAQLIDNIPGTVFTVGDNVYESGTSAEFNNCYDPTWGRFKNRTYPTVGNHEYSTAGASGYFNYFGAAAGDPTKGYYSFDLGGWHIIVLNSECAQVGGCNASSPQGQWLQADLAANPRACTLAIMHRPFFSSTSRSLSMESFWTQLYQAGADIVLAGHQHNYERFAPQNPQGVADPNGIREFVVGMGGRSLFNFAGIAPNSEVRDNTTYGVLKLTLHPTSYDWEFVPVAGQTFTDSGSAFCVTP